MKSMTSAIARHLFPTQIYLLLEKMCITSLPWEYLARMKGTWMTSFGIDGEARFDDHGRLKSIGNHIGIVYGDKPTFVCHKPSSTLRIEFKDESFTEVVAVSDGPHCCAKRSPVRYVQNDDITSEVVDHVSGNTNVFKFHSELEYPIFMSPATEVIWEGDLMKGYKVRDREFIYQLHETLAIPTAITSGDQIISEYEVVIRDRRLMQIKYGPTVLLDLTNVWPHIPQGEEGLNEFSGLLFEALFMEPENV